MSGIKGPDRAPEEKLAQWIRDYQAALLRSCYLYLQDRGLAEDAVQETYLKAYQHWADFRAESSEKTWLFRIAINTCRDMRRSGVVPPPRPAAHARYAAGRAGQLRAQGRAAHAAGGKPAPQTERSRAPLLLSGFFRDGNRAGAEYQPVFGFRTVEKGKGSAQARNGRRL